MPRAIGRASTLPAGPLAVGPAHSREMNERRRGHGILFRKAPADTSLPAHRQVKHLTQRASWAKVFEARPCQHRVDVREFAVARARILHRFAVAFETELLLHVQRCRVVGERAGIDDVAQIGLDRKSTRLNSSHLGISYAVFCLKKKTR